MRPVSRDSIYTLFLAMPMGAMVLLLTNTLSGLLLMEECLPTKPPINIWVDLLDLTVTLPAQLPNGTREPVSLVLLMTIAVASAS